ncbi:Chloroperoxidase [Xylariales sp. PMI_506]|nr:Chloroperoxidase [Xylariales sp. PMI_506]
MKASIRSFGLCATFLLTSFSALVQSFPTAQNLGKLINERDITPEKVEEAIQTLKSRQLTNYLTTPISVTGAHVFQPPNFANGDQRGPCPGLNALANHGYLSRDGAVGILEVIVQVNLVLGMGVDLTTLLALVSTLDVGAPLAVNPGFSIGGPTPKVSNFLGLLGGLLALPQGLDYTHNIIEADGSSTREDLYVTGDSWTMNMTKFLEVYNAIPVNGAMTMDDIYARNAKRWDESVATNPYFYYGPYSGIFARNGGYMFGGRLLSNHSAAYPFGGNMTRDVFASFWGVYKDSTGQLVYKKGWEQIPANWYRSPTDYGLVETIVDILAMGAKYPKLLSIGGNLGAVNTFAGVDFADITGGVLNLTKLLEGNNLLCFVLEVLQMAVPNQLASVYATLSPILQTLNPITGAITNLSCPIFSTLQLGGTNLLTGLLNTYPGAAKAGVAL